VAEKTAYERKSLRFSNQDVQSAISYGESKHITGKVAEWRDTKSVGLTLRITPGKVVWYVRRRKITLRLGLASEITLDAARYFAEQTHLAAGRKRDLREFGEADAQIMQSQCFAEELGDRLCAALQPGLVRPLQVCPCYGAK
jgi:hypothetical protein